MMVKKILTIISVGWYTFEVIVYIIGFFGTFSALVVVATLLMWDDNIKMQSIGVSLFGGMATGIMLLFLNSTISNMKLREYGVIGSLKRLYRRAKAGKL